MSRFLFAVAFLLGAIAILWMGWAFVGNDSLALTVTVLIAGVYAIGLVELLQYRRETGSLQRALLQLRVKNEPFQLDQWLAKLAPSLHNAVRLRIEGERVALPAPVLTPYLVGLLVMLGLLGTFLGMVDTLQGAVVALEGTTELQAIRAGLTAPIKGLGLAFGTSVAGVAGSAMLGLQSTMSRRDRMLATRVLDGNISTVMRQHSLVHNRRETYRALQDQAQSLPAVAQSLHSLAAELQRMATQVGEQLIANQTQFAASAEQHYGRLADSVAATISTAMAENGRQQQLQSAAMATQITPLVEGLVADIAAHSTSTHQSLTSIAEHQLQQLTTALLASNQRSAADQLRQQHQQDSERLDQWQQALQSAQQQATSEQQLQAKEFTAQLERAASSQLGVFNSATAELKSLAGALKDQAQGAAAQLQDQQLHFSQQTQRQAEAQLSQVSELMAATQALSSSRLSAEQAWLEQYQQRMDDVSSALKEQSGALIEAFALSAADAVTQQQQGDERRLALWSEAYQSAQQLSQHQINAAASHFVAQITQLGGDQQLTFERVSRDISELSASLSEQWQLAGAQSLSQQQQLLHSTDQRSASMIADFSELSTHLSAQWQLAGEQSLSQQQQLLQSTQHSNSALVTEFGGLIKSSEQLVQSRIDSEQQWRQQQGQHIEQLNSTLQSGLQHLREDETHRAKAVLQRLQALQSSAAEQLAKLGQALEQPMTRLIATASETPKAAAEVIGLLRRELTDNTERDNRLLQERQTVMEQLNTLSQSLAQTTGAQQQAVQAMTDSAAVVLQQAGTTFNGSAIELSSLGEAFLGGVSLFAQANDKMIASLDRIEASMDKSAVRSDQQLSYYVAQAREIIDHSMMSQKEIFEELRRLSHQDDLHSVNTGKA